MEIQKKYKLLVIRAKFLKQSLEITNEIFDLATSEFMAEVSSRTIIESPPPPPPTESQPEKVYHGSQNSEDDILPIEKEQKDNNLKTVFRKIATQVHPDKLSNKSEFEKEYKNILFEKARLSFETNDYHGIVEVAEELGIKPPPPTQQQVEMMKTTNNRMEKEINTIKNSIVWNWYHGADDARSLLLGKYIEAIRKNNDSRT